MGKFKRIKDIFNKVKKLIKDAGDKVIKPVIKKVIKHAPGLMKVLVKVIKATDKVGARRVILNLIPEAGPYVNQAVDYLIKAQEKGVIDDACSLFQKVIDGRIDMKTFVEDVVFFFDENKKINNVAFGLGQIAEYDILCKYAPGWKDETRELLMEFMENYKTAYCLKRYDYIRDIFADDAVIIVGNVVKHNMTLPVDNRVVRISDEGNASIRYNRYTKDEYLENLRRTFARNEFINIRFTNNDIQWLEKYESQELYAIQIGQEYNSSRYADKGFLFLLIDMTDHDAPLIRIRTWQPNEVDMSKLYNAGDFYNE